MTDFAILPDLLRSLLGNPVSASLVALVSTAAVIDYRTGRIPNWLTAPGMLLALVLHAWQASTPAAGLLHAGGGLLAGLALLLPFWLVRAIGAGDVKLMAMVGAFLGAGGALGAALLTFVAGGVLAIVYMAAGSSWSRVGANLRVLAFSMLTPGAGGLRVGSASAGKLPYGIGICAGTLAFLVLRTLGFA